MSKMSGPINFNINTVRRRSTIQTGQTCWFHSILNGFLVDDKGRRYLQRALADYLRTMKNSENRRLFSTENSARTTCLTSLRPTHIFFKTIHTLLAGRAPSSTLTNIPVRSIIPSIRNNVEIQANNVSQRLYELLTSLKLTDYCSIYDVNGHRVQDARSGEYIKIVDNYWDNNAAQLRTHVPHVVGNTRLTFAIFQLISSTGNRHSSHFITGYVSRSGARYIIDSNGFVGRINGDILSDENYKNFCTRTYGAPFEMIRARIGVYMKSILAPGIKNSITGKRGRNNVATTDNKTNKKRQVKRQRVGNKNTNMPNA